MRVCWYSEHQQRFVRMKCLLIKTQSLYKTVRWVSGRKINFFQTLPRNLSQSKVIETTLIFSNIAKKFFFEAKIPLALKRRFLTTAIIKYSTNCRARLLTKFEFEGFFLLRVCRSALHENKAHKVCVFNVFFFYCNHFFVWHLLWRYRHDLKYITFHLGSAQNSNFLERAPKILPFRTSLKI